MTALELVVFEKEPGRYGGEPRYNSPDGFWAYPASHVDGYAQEKRLTDAELAASYWRSGWIAESERTRQADREAQTLYRFATLPHYDTPTTEKAANQ